MRPNESEKMHLKPRPLNPHRTDSDMSGCRTKPQTESNDFRITLCYGHLVGPKVYSPFLQYLRSISTSLSTVDNRSMEQQTSTIPELMQEIDDLYALIRNKDLQLVWAKQQNQQLRTKLNRYEATLGIAA
jgi:pantothenate kinase-related protein Tda10